MGKDDHGPEWGRHVFTRVDPSNSYARKCKARKTAKRKPSPESFGVGTPPAIREQDAEETETGPSIGNVKRTVRLMALASEAPSVPVIEQRLRSKYGESPSKIVISQIVREFESALKLLIETGIVTKRALREYRNRE